jgi:hypothetical protein
MPKDESTNSNSEAVTPKRRDAVFGKSETGKGAASGTNGSGAPSRTWSAAMIAGVSAAGLGLLVAAGISGAAISQAVDHSHRDKSGSSEMRDHGKDGMPGNRDGAPVNGPGMQGPGMQAPGMDEPGSAPVDPNVAPVPGDANGDAPVTGQSPTDPSGDDRDRGDRGDRGDRPGRNG